MLNRTTQSAYLKDHILAFKGCCAPKFLYALENHQILLAQGPQGTGAPLQLFPKGIKNRLKLQQMSFYNLGVRRCSPSKLALDAALGWRVNASTKFGGTALP